MNDKIESIDTFYKGHLFRSRLEARWAVFFTALGIKYEYEREGYLLDGIGPYLVDFWLPHWPDPEIDDGKTGVYVEIKRAQATKEEYEKAYALAERTGQNVFIFQGQPYPGEHRITQIQFWDLGRVDPPIVIHDLRFIEEIEEFQYEGFSAEKRYSISLSNGVQSGYGFVCDPLVFGMTRKELGKAFAAARSARFEFGVTGQEYGPDGLPI